MQAEELTSSRKEEMEYASGDLEVTARSSAVPKNLITAKRNLKDHYMKYSTEKNNREVKILESHFVSSSVITHLARKNRKVD